MKLSRGQAPASRPSITRGTSALPQLTQKCPTARLRRGCVLLLLLLGRRLHVGDTDLVPAALLGCIEGLVGALHQAREKRGFVGGCDADADRQLQPAWEGGRGDLRPDSLGESARSRLGRPVEGDPVLFASAGRAPGR